MLKDDARHERTDRLIGRDDRLRLSSSRVLVAGLGGVGAACALTLARAGIGSLTLIDADAVAESNLNRQWVAFQSTIGVPKVEVARNMIADIDPAIITKPLALRITADNALHCVLEHDFIVDAVDDVTAKIALALAARDANIPIIASMGAGNRLDPTRFRVSELSKTNTDPLARTMRKLCREASIDSLMVVWSDEPPQKVPADAFGCHSPASIATVPPAAGLALAAYVIECLRRA